MISALRADFNSRFDEGNYSRLTAKLGGISGTGVQFRIAETPVFLPAELLETIADEGAQLTRRLLADRAYLDKAEQAIPSHYRVAGTSAHPNFLTADFALVAGPAHSLEPRLVELQAFPSVFGFQALLCDAYREVYGLSSHLRTFLGGLDEMSYWDLLRRAIVGRRDPQNVVLTEVDPLHQKTLPDFLITSQRLGIAIVDIATLEPEGSRLFYRDASGRRIPIERIYNRAIVDELIARKIQLPFDLTVPWDVEWAGHPNWYFLMSKFSIPFLSRFHEAGSVVPPAVFLGDFIEGSGRELLASAGVRLPQPGASSSVYSELLLKPLFSFAGKGIEFEPSEALLLSIPEENRQDYLLQQRMRFEPTIATPHGLTQAEIRILYVWPDGEELTPALSLVRLGRGKMMGVDHNKGQAWVGASAAFFPPK